MVFFVQVIDPIAVIVDAIENTFVFEADELENLMVLAN